jgi:DNA-binding response OmpR family regulator
MAKILVVEDEADLRMVIEFNLKKSGHEVFLAQSGAEGLRLVREKKPELVLLDLMLPDISGLDVCRQIKEGADSKRITVIMLTARGEEADRVTGFEVGADDYVVKPFSVDELLARVEAVLRRSPGRPTDVCELPIAGGRVDFERCEVRFDDGTREELSERERALLRYFACHAGRAIGRDELLANVWQIDARGVTTRTIDMHVARLREKLRDSGDEPRVLLTVRGKGYMLAKKA